MKRIMAMLLLLSLLLSAMPMTAIATETAEETVREPGSCGENMTWSYDAGTLTISGSGEMDDYSETDAPWLEYKDSITKLVISGDITSIGAYAFRDYDALQKVYFGSAMHTIHKRAFYDCDSLTTFTLPATFRKFGEECFMSCDMLREIRCLGGMPTFQTSWLWDCPVSVFYPTTNPWPAEYVTPLYQSYQGKIQIFMGNGIEESDEYLAEAAATEQAATEPEETVPETTMAPTESATEPVTEPVTEATEAIEETVAQTEETKPAMTEPDWLRETQPQEEPEDEKSMSMGLWFGLFLITGVLCLILIGALVFRRRRY